MSPHGILGSPIPMIRAACNAEAFRLSWLHSCSILGVLLIYSCRLWRSIGTASTLSRPLKQPYISVKFSNRKLLHVHRSIGMSEFSSPHISPGFVARRVRRPWIRGARRSARAGVLEQYVEHGGGALWAAQRRRRGLIASRSRKLVRYAGWPRVSSRVNRAVTKLQRLSR